MPDEAWKAPCIENRPRTDVFLTQSGKRVYVYENLFFGDREDP